MPEAPTNAIPAQPDAAETAAEKESGRVEAFSDGVFGIALTLLVLELKVPHAPADAGATSAWLRAALAAEWPSYFAFLVSFLSVLIMWVHHHAMFRFVRRADNILLYVNGIFLLFVTTVPFPTAVIAEYLDTPAATAAAAFYAGTFVLISAAFFTLLRTATRPGTLFPDADPNCFRALKRGYASGPPIYALATLTALISPWLCMSICIALWGLWIALPLTYRKRD